MKKYKQSISKIGTVLAITGLQVAIEYLHGELHQRSTAFDYGSQTITYSIYYGLETFPYLLLINIFGIISGLLLFFALTQNERIEFEDDKLYLKAILLSFIPTLVIGINFILRLQSQFNPYHLFQFFPIPIIHIWHWVSSSQVPSFWLGIVLGWAFRRKLFSRRTN